MSGSLEHFQNECTEYSEGAGFDSLHPFMTLQIIAQTELFSNRTTQPRARPTSYSNGRSSLVDAVPSLARGYEFERQVDPVFAFPQAFALRYRSHS